MDPKYYIIIFIGLFCGIIESSIGISCMIIPLLLLSGLFIDHKEALGTTLCATLLPLSVGAVYIHYKSDNVKLDYAVILAIAYFIGATFASNYVVHSIDNKDLALFGSIILFCMSLYYFIKYYDCK
jgi:uncharacterized membrane protein YfcA